ncbi:MAG: hypothetical protein WCJ61_05475 [Paludibacter sp.]
MYQSAPKNIIIAGGNAAGPSAAAKAKRIDPNANVILFEAGRFISTGTCEIPYVLSNEIEDYKKIVFYSPESFEKDNPLYENKIKPEELFIQMQRQKFTTGIQKNVC